MEEDITRLWFTISAFILFLVYPVESTFTLTTDEKSFDDHTTAGCKMAVIHSEAELQNVTSQMQTSGAAAALIGLQYTGESYIWRDYTPFVYSNFEVGQGLHRTVLCASNTSTIKCENGDVIRSHYAHFGRTSTKVCSFNAYGQPSSGSCLNPKTYTKIKTDCHEKTTCTLTAQASDYTAADIGTCANSDQLYLEFIYDCVPDALKAKSCVYVNQTTGKWYVTDCNTPMKAVCEPDATIVDALDCKDYDSTNTNTLECPAERPVAVGCLCPCNIYAIDDQARNCTCMCPTNATIVATCCSRRLASITDPGYNRKPTLGCTPQGAVAGTNTCGANEKALSCSADTATTTTKTITGCTAAAGLVAGWCCKTTLDTPAMANLFQSISLQVGSPDRTEAGVSLIDDCYKKCIEDPRCLAVLHASSECKMYYKITGGTSTTVMRRRFPYYSSNLLTDYKPLVSYLNLHVRRLDGIAVGNITFHTCLESCTEEDTCQQVDWKQDGICYASYPPVNGSHCKLLTHAAYQTTNAVNIRDSLKYGIIIDCYFAQNVTSAACKAEYAMTGCSCGKHPMMATVPSSGTCNCPVASGSTNTSAFIMCCRHVKSSPRVCPPGQEMNMTTGICKSCLNGLVSTGFGSKCTICPPGHVSNATGASNCTGCQKDFIPDPPRQACQKCPMGHFTNGTAFSVCIPVDCGQPPNVSNSTVTVNTTTFASVASYKCLPGFEMANATSFLVCGCYKNWTGQNFTCKDINECLSSPCMNNGTCNDLINQYNCSCKPGYTGVHCETDLDECASDPCTNGGTCKDLVNAFNCSCVPGYTGINCETDIDECASSPCASGATCVDQVNAYECKCPNGFTGANCETDIDECAATPPVCQNNATCAQGAPGAYTCTCPKGFSGVNCETNLDECLSNPCKNSGVCTDKVYDFDCACPLPYTGKVCDIQFQPTGCKANSSAAQLLTGKTKTVKHNIMTTTWCVTYCNIYSMPYSATRGGDTCTCGTGIAASPAAATCDANCAGNSTAKCGNTNMDAAASLTTITPQPKSVYAETPGCYQNNIPGSVDMSFPYSTANFDNCLKACGAIDHRNVGMTPTECKCYKSKPSVAPVEPASCASPCTDDASKQCGAGTGAPGFMSVYGASVMPSDADPCLSNPCQNNASCSNYTQSNGAPFYNCTCKPGYTGVHCENDIDECASTPCQNLGKCNNNVNQYNCSCPLGYTGVNCESVYNCSMPKSVQNGTFTPTTPVTTYGNNVTYKCYDGFELGNNSDGKTTCNVTGWQYPLLNCYSVDDCKNVTCQNGGTCIDAHKNYTCKCQCPYSGRHCETVVDCGVPPNVTFGSRNYTGNSSYGVLVTYTCLDGYKMQGGTGLRRCKCENKWVGDNVTCVEINECSSNPCKYGGTCNDLINKYNCTCPVGTNGTNCEINKDDCIGKSCGQGTCQDLVNDYKCLCPPLTTGSSCEKSTAPPAPPPDANLSGIIKVNPRSNIECEQAPLFVDTELLNDGVTAGTTLVFRCTKSGMAFPDVTGDATRRSIYCNGQGKWEPAPRGCEVVQCPYYPLPAGTARNTENRFYGEPVTYQCIPGLSWPDGSRIRTYFCQQDGTWSTTIPPCTRLKCGDIKDFTNATLVSLDAGDVYRPGAAKLRCPGFQVFANGAPERTTACTPSGKWIPSDLTCDDRCVPPAWVENTAGGTIMTTTDKSAIVFVSCQLGYRYPDGVTKKKLTCNKNLLWDSHPPPCEEKVCESVPTVGGATPSSKLALVGHNVTYTCEKFFWFPSLRKPNATIYCHIANVSWSKEPENCSEIHCGAKEKVVNSNYNNLIADTPENNVTYSCQGSKKFFNGKPAKTSVCTFQGNWSHIGDNCDDNRCPHPSIPQYSKPTLINATKGAVIKFTCLDGYVYPGATSMNAITCKNDLTWNATLPNCKPIICPVLHNISTIRVTSANHTFMAEVNVSCARGYKFSDLSGDYFKKVTCTKYSNWTTPITATICEKIKCEKPRVAQYAWPYPILYHVNDTVTYYCKTGFNFDIGIWYKDIVCQENGLWTDETVKGGCSVITCPFPTWDYGTWNTTNFVVFSTVNYTCPVNQTFKDRSAVKISKCTIDSKWSPALQPCFDINSNVFTVPPTDAKNANTIGIISGIFVSVVVGIIVLLDVAPPCAALLLGLK